MKETIIAYVNSLIEPLEHFSKVHGLAELIEDRDGNSIASIYTHSGEYEPVNNEDFDDGVLYHRDNGPWTQEETDTFAFPKLFYNRTFPFKLVGVVLKDILKEDDKYIDDKISENIVAQISAKTTASLATSLNAQSATVEITSVSTDRKDIQSTEWDNTIKLDPKYLVISVEYNVVVTASKKCFEIFTCDEQTIANFNKCTVIDGINPASPIILMANQTYTCLTAGVVPLAYSYPFSNEPNTFGTGSDGFIEVNIIGPLRPTTQNVRINALVNDTTLNGNNKHGNTSRFTDTLGTQIYANDIIQVHDIGLEFYRVVQPVANFSTFIIDALGTDFGGNNSTLGLTNWFGPTSKQLVPLFDYSLTAVLFYSPFNLAGNLQTSTTRPDNTGRNLIIQNSGGFILQQVKTNTLQYIFCRPID